MDSSAFLGGRPSQVSREAGLFKCKVHDFLAFGDDLHNWTSPLLLRDLMFSSAGTVRKYLSSRSRESPKVHAGMISILHHLHDMGPHWKLLYLSSPWKPGKPYHGSLMLIKEYMPSCGCFPLGYPTRQTYVREYTRALQNFRIS